jgi:hypothetical protein
MTGHTAIIRLYDFFGTFPPIQEQKPGKNPLWYKNSVSFWVDILIPIINVYTRYWINVFNEGVKQFVEKIKPYNDKKLEPLIGQAIYDDVFEVLNNYGFDPIDDTEWPEDIGLKLATSNSNKIHDLDTNPWFNKMLFFYLLQLKIWKNDKLIIKEKKWTAFKFLPSVKLRPHFEANYFKYKMGKYSFSIFCDKCRKKKIDYASLIIESKNLVDLIDDDDVVLDEEARKNLFQTIEDESRTLRMYGDLGLNIQLDTRRNINATAKKRFLIKRANEKFGREDFSFETYDDDEVEVEKKKQEFNIEEKNSPRKGKRSPKKLELEQPVEQLDDDDSEDKGGIEEKRVLRKRKRAPKKIEIEQQDHQSDDDDDNDEKQN